MFQREISVRGFTSYKKGEFVRTGHSQLQRARKEEHVGGERRWSSARISSQISQPGVGVLQIERPLGGVGMTVTRRLTGIRSESYLSLAGGSSLDQKPDFAN